MAWVADDGSYGGGFPITFEANQLTDEQWNKVSEMVDGDRYEYVTAILDGNEELIAEIEEDNFG